MKPPPAVLTDDERVAWLRLSRSDGVGPRTFAGLLQRFGTVAAALDALPSLARHRPNVVVAPRDVVMRELDAGRKRGVAFIGLNEPDYPTALRAIDSAPPVLLVLGQRPVLARTMAAIVGSRNASGPGLIFAERLAAGLGAAGVVVASGLARGIDVQAHRAALRTGTVAVLAGGHNHIYPGEHAQFAERIAAEGGAVVSEMPLGWEPRGRDFPRRNRIVSGLAMATVVVEAARRSGSLITARFANEQGREVFAVPGSPLDPRAEGTNDLLRQGASLCTAPEDVVDALDAITRPGSAEPRQVMRWAEPADLDGPDLEDRPGTEPPAGSSAEAEVLQWLGPSPIGFDDLVRLSGLTAAELRVALLNLELEGLAATKGGAVVRVMT